MARESKGPTAIEIDQQLRAVEALFDIDDPEMAQVPLDEWMADLLQMLDEKLLGYKLLIKKAEGDRDYNAELVRSFQAAKARHSNFREFLRESLAHFMHVRKIETGENFLRSRSATVQLRYTERKIEVENGEALVEQGFATRYSVLTLRNEVHVSLREADGTADYSFLIFESDVEMNEIKIKVNMDAIKQALDSGEHIEGIKVIPPKPYIILT